MILEICAEFAPGRFRPSRQFSGSGGEKGGERRGAFVSLQFHLHFRVGGQCDESRHHSLSYQRLIHPLNQQLESDWTEPAVMSQWWAGHWDKSEQHRQ